MAQWAAPPITNEYSITNPTSKHRMEFARKKVIHHNSGMILITPLSTIPLPPCPDALLFSFSPFLSTISRLLRNGITRSRCPLGFGVPASSCWAQGTSSTPFPGVTEPATIYDKSCSRGFASGNYREFLKYVFRPSESVIHGI